MVKPDGDGPDDVSFHNHEVASTRLVGDLFRRLRFSKQFTEDVAALVRQHQYKYDREWTDKAVRRFIRKVGIGEADLGDLDSHPLFLLRQADRMGNELKVHLPITRKQRDFQARIVTVYRSSTAHSLRDLKVNGRDVMDTFGLEASETIGRVIAHLFNRVEESPELNTKESLLREARKFLRKQEDGAPTSNAKNVSAVSKSE
jgi:hypothetical protein